MMGAMIILAAMCGVHYSVSAPTPDQPEIDRKSYHEGDSKCDDEASPE